MAKGKLQMTDNIMAKAELTKDRQYHGQRETDKRQQISWPKGNCLYHGQRETDKRQPISWPKGN